jgi:ribosome-binding factor A
LAKRILQVNQLIKRELGQFILKEVDFPDGILVTITRVDTTPNLAESRIYISTMPEEREKEILEILKKAVYELQQKLNKRLKMRPIPKIKFVEERKTVEAGRIEEILNNLKKKEK